MAFSAHENSKGPDQPPAPPHPPPHTPNPSTTIIRMVGNGGGRGNTLQDKGGVARWEKDEGRGGGFFSVHKMQIKYSLYQNELSLDNNHPFHKISRGLVKEEYQVIILG